VAAPLHLGLAQPPLQRGWPGKKRPWRSCDSFTKTRPPGAAPGRTRERAAGLLM
jgi:hypothetical protein